MKSQSRRYPVELAPQPFCEQVLRERYLAPGERSIEDVQRRMANALASVEAPASRDLRRREFLKALLDGFIPGGRIQAAAGLDTAATLMNCFVQPMPDADSMARWQDRLDEALVTMQAGGGVGYDLSSLPPEDSEKAFEPDATPPSPLRLLDLMEHYVSRPLATGTRRAAQMAVLRIDHPDVGAFIERKRQGGLTHFNLSVAVTDAFMQAVHLNRDWPLTHASPPRGRNHSSPWVNSNVYAQLPARRLMTQLQDASFDIGEPGIIFIDRVNRDNSLSDREVVRAANPCGEQFLPDYGSCNLGSIDLSRFVRAPFTARSHFDFRAFEQIVPVAVRALDNVIDLARWPLPQQAEIARRQRRIGLGFTGLGDALIMLGIRYDSTEARIIAERITRRLRDGACVASIKLAIERGSFPDLDVDAYLAQPHAASRLPPRIRAQIRKYGMRNSHRLSIAPAGSISIAFADNVSSGIEPVFDWQVRHRGRMLESGQPATVDNHAWRLFKAVRGKNARLTPAFINAACVSPIAQLRMLATLTPYIDAGISKTIRLPDDYPRHAYSALARIAWLWGVKAFTCYRANVRIEPAVIKA